MRIILTDAERDEIERASTATGKTDLRPLLSRVLPEASAYVVGGESGEDFIEIGFLLRALHARAEVKP